MRKVIQLMGDDEQLSSKLMPVLVLFLGLQLSMDSDAGSAFAIRDNSQRLFWNDYAPGINGRL